MATARTGPTRQLSYSFDGIYLPREVSGYLLATMPAERRPPTSQRILRWIRAGLIAPGLTTAPGREVVINFADLISCQAITLLREAGLSLTEIRRAEGYFGNLYRLARPFAYRQFWYSSQDVMGRWENLLISGNRGGQIAWDFLRQWLTPLPMHLEFSEATGGANCWRPADSVSLRPNVQFGQPCLDGTRIPTSAIWSYANAGDSLAFIAESYGLDVAEVEQAVAWEERVRTALDTQAAIPA
jgi:uncharacterized protein (DUF433 family)